MRQIECNMNTLICESRCAIFVLNETNGKCLTERRCLNSTGCCGSRLILGVFC